MREDRTKETRLVPAQQTGSHIDTDMILMINRMLEGSGGEDLLIRFPHLKVSPHFHYSFISSGEGNVRNHAHWHWEIARIFVGEARYFIQNPEHVVCPDSSHYLIIPPKITHGWEATKVPLLINSWQVKIEPEDAIGEQTINNLRQVTMDSRFLIEASSVQIQAENLLWKMSHEKYVQQVFGSILSGFARIILGDLLARIDPWPAGVHDLEFSVNGLADRLRTFLDDNLEHPIVLKDLEKHFHYSGRHLARIFQKVHRISIGQYFRQQRIKLAMHWLETTGRSIKDIALSLGFGSPSQFCRCFKEQTGMTPSQYREQRHAILDQAIRESTPARESNPKERRKIK